MSVFPCSGNIIIMITDMSHIYYLNNTNNCQDLHIPPNNFLLHVSSERESG